MSEHDVVIRVENLSKAYLIGSRDRADTLAAAVAGVVRGPLRNLRNLRRLNTFGLEEHEGGEDILWALKDVNFEVKKGEVLGIIGRNGAGKSTLLKILSRVAEPTRGRATIWGRVSALLEVGTGFHPELTGRENVYLNGTILAMKKTEIDSKFDQIVEFSGVERFLDTPVKRYSSGMRVRLAFAVAAHLEPEVLIIDEVLAVGDAEFQQKCLGKMGDVAAGEGRTVIFVSHNLGSVLQLCPQALLLENGGISALGNSHEVISRYLGRGNTHEVTPAMSLGDWPNRKGNGIAKFAHAELRDHTGEVSGVLLRNEPARINVLARAIRSNQMVSVSVVCTCRRTGTKVFQMSQFDGNVPPIELREVPLRITIDIPAVPLQAGDYALNIGMHDHNMMPIDVVQEVLPFQVVDDLTRSPRPFESRNTNGYCSLLAKWSYDVATT